MKFILLTLIHWKEEEAQSLRKKIRNAELYLKEATPDSEAWLHLHSRRSPACRNIARTSVKVGKTKLPPFVKLQTQEEDFK